MKFDYQYSCLLSILIENQPSLLTRIINLLSRRGFLIESLTIGSTEYYNLTRLIIILSGNLSIIDQLTRQLYKIFSVIKVSNLTHVPTIKRELILYKIINNSLERKQLLDIATIFNANIVDFTNKTITIEVYGDPTKIVAIEQMLSKFGILEKVRTGLIAISKESITGGILYTLDRENLRQNMISPHISELEIKLYLD